MPKLHKKPVTVPDTPRSIMGKCVLQPVAEPPATRPEKKYIAPDRPESRVIPDFHKKFTWEDVKERFPRLSPGEGMEQIMLQVLQNTWHTWIRGDGVFFNFVTEAKKPGWQPEYWKIMGPGGSGRPAKQVEA